MRQLFKTHILNKFANSFRSGEDGSYFLTFGRSTPWAEEASPGTVSETLEDDIQVWENMLGAKRISSAKVIYMTDKSSFTAGGGYTYPAALSNTDYYADPSKLVYTTEGYVYKIIKSGHSTSQTALQDLNKNYSVDTFGNMDADQHLFKLLYKIPDNLKEFITDTHIPLLEVDLISGIQNRYVDERQFRYKVKRDAVDGSIDCITINQGSGVGTYHSGGLFEKTPINSSTGWYLPANASAGTTQIQILTGNGENTAASLTNDHYNGYAFYIISGENAGEVRRITDYGVDSGVGTIHVSPGFTTIPKNSSEENKSGFIIAPFIGITGDGSNAEAIGVIGPTGKLLDTTVINKGLGYTRARAEITGDTVGTTITVFPSISPYGGHGSNLLDETRPTKALIVVRIQKDEEGNAPIFNDYRQYGILADPIISAGYTNEGLVAGAYDTTSTVVSVNAPTGGQYSSVSFLSGDNIIGKFSNTCGKVATSVLGTDNQKSAILTINDLRGEFKPGEEFLGIRDKGSDVFNNQLVGSGFINYQETTLPSTDRVYRMTVSAGITSDPDTVINRDSLSIDSLVTGASGATATLVQWEPWHGATGTSGSILLGNIIRESDSGITAWGITLPLGGFSDNETITVGSSTYTINNVKGPELVKSSGRLLVVENTTAITRTFEQEEEIRFFIDL